MWRVAGEKINTSQRMKGALWSLVPSWKGNPVVGNPTEARGVGESYRGLPRVRGHGGCVSAINMFSVSPDLSTCSALMPCRERTPDPPRTSRGRHAQPWPWWEGHLRWGCLAGMTDRRGGTPPAPPPPPGNARHKWHLMVAFRPFILCHTCAGSFFTRDNPKQMLSQNPSRDTQIPNRKWSQLFQQLSQQSSPHRQRELPSVPSLPF